MAGQKQKERDRRQGIPTGLDDLREEFGHFLTDMTQGWVDKASGKVSGLTDRLTDMAEGRTATAAAGGMLGIGSRVLHGDSPLKAAVGQKAKDAKDSVVGKVKSAVGGGGGAGKGGDVKAVNIIESLDVGVSLRTAYDQWTQFEEFSDFTKGVHGVSPGGRRHDRLERQGRPVQPQLEGDHPGADPRRADRVDLGGRQGQHDGLRQLPRARPRA